MTIPIVGGRSFIRSAHAHCFSVLATSFAFRLSTLSKLYSKVVPLPMKWGAVGEAARARNLDASGERIRRGCMETPTRSRRQILPAMMDGMLGITTITSARGLKNTGDLMSLRMLMTPVSRVPVHLTAEDHPIHHGKLWNQSQSSLGQSTRAKLPPTTPQQSLPR